MTLALFTLMSGRGVLALADSLGTLLLAGIAVVPLALFGYLFISDIIVRRRHRRSLQRRQIGKHTL